MHHSSSLAKSSSSDDDVFNFKWPWPASLVFCCWRRTAETRSADGIDTSSRFLPWTFNQETVEQNIVSLIGATHLSTLPALNPWTFNQETVEQNIVSLIGATHLSTLPLNSKMNSTVQYMSWIQGSWSRWGWGLTGWGTSHQKATKRKKLTIAPSIISLRRQAGWTYQQCPVTHIVGPKRGAVTVKVGMYSSKSIYILKQSFVRNVCIEELLMSFLSRKKEQNLCS